MGEVFARLQLRRPRLAAVLRGLAFLLAWAFLDALLNMRFPGSEMTFWYPLPSIDVVVLMVLLALAGWRGWLVRDGVRFALVVAVVVVRIFRFADGLVESHFHRPFSLYMDGQLVPNLVSLLRSTVSGPRLILLALSMAIGVVVLGALAWQALRAVERSLATSAGRRVFVAALVVCAVLSPLWSPRRDPHLHRGLFGLSVVPRLAREVSFLRHAEDYRRDRVETTARVQDELRAAPHGLDRLHRADVLLIFVESYGETAVARPDYARRVAPLLQAFQRDLDAHGFAASSGLLSSSTYGGRSWLAHATLRTGTRVDDGLAYSVLVETRPVPQMMAGFFKQAGYRTVLVQPGTTQRSPEGLVAGFDEKYYAMDLDYHGPAFKWATMPDQYVLDFVDRREVARAPDAAPRAPVFIEYALVSSHSPWSLQPRFVADWDRLRDGGRVFNEIEPVRFAVGWFGLQDAGDAYLTERIAGDTLVIFLGDHQPSAEITGDSPSYGVPIHVVSRDQALVMRFVSGAGFVPGMWPRAGEQAPRLPMERFLPVFLGLFSTPRDATSGPAPGQGSAR